MNLQQLQHAAEALGAEHELNPRYIGEKRYNSETGQFERYQFGWYFGIRNLSGRDSDSWTWFESIGKEQESEFMFVERYSCRTGKSNKGWRERYKANAKVYRLNGIEY